MSASNAKSKSELKSKLGKRKKDEEFIDDEVESPDRRLKSRPKHRSHGSERVNFAF